MPGVQLSLPNWCPDVDTTWSRNPGALFNMGGFVPMKRGQYASVGRGSLSHALTGSDIALIKLFRQINGNIRLLAFRTADIDEYSTLGVRTNRLTGMGGASWSAAAWGNQIIATNGVNPVQSSTGLGFTALGGSPPTAYFVAVNRDFVMLANTSAASDEVRWSGIGNPATWATSFATQAGSYRLREAPGPIVALVPYRGGFVAFKQNAMWVGTYVGPQSFVWDWQMVSSSIGAASTMSVQEIDNKLYFMHSSGVWEFDGQQLRNVSELVFNSMISEFSRLNPWDTSGPGPTGTQYGVAISSFVSARDDIEGLYILAGFIGDTAPPQQTQMRGFAYNTRTQRWGRIGKLEISGDATDPCYFPGFVQGSSTDLYDFTGQADTRVAMFSNGDGVNRANVLSSFNYPAEVDSNDVGLCGVGGWLMAAGNFGSIDGSQLLNRVYVECLPGSSSDVVSTGQLDGFSNAQRTKADPGTAALAPNTELDCLDGMISSRFQTATLIYGDGKTAIVNGLGVEYAEGGGPV